MTVIIQQVSSHNSVMLLLFIPLAFKMFDAV